MLPYSNSDRMLAQTLIYQGLKFEQFSLENIVKANPKVIFALKDIALEEELTDSRENNYLFIKDEELTSDIRIIAGRFEQLKDSPLLAEVNKLPTLEECKNNLNFNRQYQKELDKHYRWNTVKRDILAEYISCNKKYAEFWQSAVDARSEFFYTLPRRRALLKIVETIGRENFNKGIFLKPVPYEQFFDN